MRAHALSFEGKGDSPWNDERTSLLSGQAIQNLDKPWNDERTSLDKPFRILETSHDEEAQPWGGPKADISEAFRPTGNRGAGAEPPLIIILINSRLTVRRPSGSLVYIYIYVIYIYTYICL